jgi:hypothetical protein
MLDKNKTEKLVQIGTFLNFFVKINKNFIITKVFGENI